MEQQSIQLDQIETKPVAPDIETASRQEILNYCLQIGENIDAIMAC